MGKKRATTAETANTQPAESSQAEVSSALRRKNRRRHLRALRDLVIRIALLLLVVYILFFHLVGITVMRSGDMHPRIDLGDLVLYYRLEKSYHAQDVIVFEKPTASIKRVKANFSLIYLYFCLFFWVSYPLIIWKGFRFIIHPAAYASNLSYEILSTS